MTFHDPLWLLLAIPLGAALWVWRPPSRAVTAMRIVILLLIVLALAGLAIELRTRAGVVVVVADRSLSMPRGADAVEREVVRGVESKRGADSRVGVVAFGRGAQLELLPGGERFSDFRTRSDEDGSDARDGLDLALSLIPRGTPGRIVLVSDGRFTGREPATAALAAAARGVAIDYRLVARSTAGDVAIDHIDAPASVSPGEAFVIGAWIDAPSEQDVQVELLRGGAVIASGTHHLAGGTNRIALRDRAAGGGTIAYTLRVAAPAGDPVPENNRARFLVGVSGPKPVLVASGSTGSRLAALLSAGGVAVDAPERPQWSLDALTNYSAVVLENLPADSIGRNQMQTLASWISDAGGGLMMTGGHKSFAPGGYFKSPLEPVLPVSMELRREHRKLNVAMVIALDRSGSMGMPAGGGRTKLDLANLSAVQVLDMLAPSDELGVVAVDSMSHVIADLDPIGDRPEVRDKILSIEVGGGGIFIYEALSTAAKMLLTAKAETRHIILFADAADSEEPGKYQELLARCRAANITVTVIGLGTPGDSDADLLRDIAQRGGGRIVFTDDANDLPRLFAQDTLIVARSAFVSDPTPVKPTAGLFSLAGRTFDGMPPVGGYNLTYLRDGASPAVVTEDEYHAPLVAAWNAGVGRVLTYAGEVDGQYTGPIGEWASVGDFHTSLARWVAGRQSPLPDDMMVTERVENGVCRIDLHLDPERAALPMSGPPRVTTLAALPGQVPSAARAEMSWRTPDDLSIEVPLRGAATYLSTVDVPGAGRVTLPPVCLPYSPELAPAAAEKGRGALEKLARMTGGRERIAADDVWRDLPRERREIPLARWLILAAIAMLLAEVLERRMRLLSAVRLPAVSLPTVRLGRRMVTRPAPKPPVRVEEAPPPEPEAAPEPPPDALVDALKKAGSRAKRKM